MCNYVLTMILMLYLLFSCMPFVSPLVSANGIRGPIQSSCIYQPSRLDRYLGLSLKNQLHLHHSQNPEYLLAPLTYKYERKYGSQKPFHNPSILTNPRSSNGPLANV